MTPDQPYGTDIQSLTVEASATPATGEAPLQVAFSANGNDPDAHPGDTLTYEWDFGVAGTDTDASTERSPTFTYEQPGTYTATVIVTDTDGAQATDTVEVAVQRGNTARRWPRTTVPRQRPTGARR